MLIKGGKIMEENNDKLKYTLKVVALTALAACLLTNTFRDVIYARNNGTVNNKVQRVAKIISDYCLFDTDPEKMADYAATGLAASVDDHYTNYYDKESFASFNTSLSNSFYGIGIVVSVDSTNNKLVVVSPVDGGPSAEAGILTGDYIVAVDGVEYSGSQMSEAVSVMRGDDIKDKKGTKVTVTVERDGERHDYVITRDIVKINTVTSKMLDDGIAYIRITEFNSVDTHDEGEQDTYDEFKAALDSLGKDGMKKLIIDLRNNPGGNLVVVNKIADELLPSGIITYTETKTGKRQEYTSGPSELDIPMAVLVNGGSASASEVLTGALKDYKKATVIGTKTFGKGIVQTVIPLGDGTGISLTTSKYFTPNGVCIHQIGIEPDIVVEATDSRPVSQLSEDEDVQLQKAIEVLKK